MKLFFLELLIFTFENGFLATLSFNIRLKLQRWSQRYFWIFFYPHEFLEKKGQNFRREKFRFFSSPAGWKSMIASSRVWIETELNYEKALYGISERSSAQSKELKKIKLRRKSSEQKGLNNSDCAWKASKQAADGRAKHTKPKRRERQSSLEILNWKKKWSGWGLEQISLWLNVTLHCTVTASITTRLGAPSKFIWKSIFQVSDFLLLVHDMTKGKKSIKSPISGHIGWNLLRLICHKSEQFKRLFGRNAFCTFRFCIIPRLYGSRNYSIGSRNDTI